MLSTVNLLAAEEGDIKPEGQSVYGASLRDDK